MCLARDLLELGKRWSFCFQSQERDRKAKVCFLLGFSTSYSMGDVTCSVDVTEEGTEHSGPGIGFGNSQTESLSSSDC